MAAAYLTSIDSSYQYDRAYKPYQPPPQGKNAPAAAPAMQLDEEEAMAAHVDEEEQAMAMGEGMDADDVPLRPVEKKRLDWRGKTYLAPLTTVGNLVSARTPSHFAQRLTHRRSHSANSASTTAPTSPVAKWCSVNRSSVEAVKNGP